MAVVVDPEQSETRAIHDLVDFREKAVLEIGCGDGRLTWRYADLAASVLALDPNEGEIATARAAMPAALGGRVAFEVADARSLELPAAGFDVALCSRSL